MLTRKPVVEDQKKPGRVGVGVLWESEWVFSHGGAGLGLQQPGRLAGPRHFDVIAAAVDTC